MSRKKFLELQEEEENNNNDDEEKNSSESSSQKLDISPFYKAFLEKHITTPFEELTFAKGILEDMTSLPNNAALNYIKNKTTDNEKIKTLGTGAMRRLQNSHNMSDTPTCQNVLKQHLLWVNDQMRIALIINELRKHADKKRVVVITSCLSDEVESFFQKLGYTYVRQEGPQSCKLPNAQKSWLPKFLYNLMGYILVKDPGSGSNFYCKPIHINGFFLPESVSIWKRHQGKITWASIFLLITGLAVWYKLKGRKL